MKHTPHIAAIATVAAITAALTACATPAPPRYTTAATETAETAAAAVNTDIIGGADKPTSVIVSAADRFYYTDVGHDTKTKLADVSIHYPKFSATESQANDTDTPKSFAADRINAVIEENFSALAETPLYDGTTNEGLETYRDTYKVVANNGRYVSVLFMNEAYSHGGPHPVKFAYGFIFEAGSGAVVDPRVLVQENALTAEGLNRPVSELIEAGIVENGKLADNFTSAYVTDGGKLGLVYGVPHAAGDYVIVEKSGFAG